jgi:hypothetical protein
LPDRKPGKRGTKPIPKELLVRELFRLFRLNCGWRNIKHPSTCRNYLKQMQRRCKFKNFCNFLTKEQRKYRLNKSTVDTSDIVSYRTNGLVKYSGKYHNPCMKFSIEISEEGIPIYGSIETGTVSDTKILDKMLSKGNKLPYEMFLDKGFEEYERRRNLKSQNCQVRMEMKKCDNNRKRGPRFTFTQEHKHERGLIEKVVGWIKAFMIMRLNRLRIKSLISAMFYFCLSYVTFMRLEKL